MVNNLSIGLLARPDQRNSMFEVFRQRFAPTQFSQREIEDPMQQQTDLARHDGGQSEDGAGDPLF